MEATLQLLCSHHWRVTNILASCMKKDGKAPFIENQSAEEQDRKKEKLMESWQSKGSILSASKDPRELTEIFFYLKWIHQYSPGVFEPIQWQSATEAAVKDKKKKKTTEKAQSDSRCYANQQWTQNMHLQRQ
ncbi:hypothetical protein CapIbe_005478 [Capra ibex]